MSLSGRIGSFVDRFLGGRGEHSITVPVMDGALKPNNYLERTAGLSFVEGADNLVVSEDGVMLSSAKRLLKLDAGGTATTVESYEAEITCLAASSAGAFAVGLDGQSIAIRGGAHDGRKLGATLKCVTAACFLDEDTLFVCNGSGEHSAGEWSRDLLLMGRTGSVSRIDLRSGEATTIVSGLAYPSGICVVGEDRIAVSEAWKHRLLSFDRKGGNQSVVLDHLPAYPGRLAPASGGGYWLAAFAVRSQLQEFVLREDRYKREMMARVDPEFWIAPALSSGRSFKEPLQSGGVIRLGIHKPWAPTRSYGLLIRLDNALQPVWSAHSRADGKRHGVTSAVEHAGRLLVTSKGKGEILVLDHLALTEPKDLSVLEAAA